MDISRLPEPLRRRAEEIERQPPVERVRGFLHTYVTDRDWDEIRLGLRVVAASTTRGLAGYLRALDALLSQPQEPGALSWLIAHDANWSLDDTSDEAAAALLRQFADMLRDVLAEVEQKKRPHG
jgi:hypothetical protein